MAETSLLSEKSFYEAHQKHLNEVRPILSTANVDQ